MPSLARQAFDLLLNTYPDWDVMEVDAQDDRTVSRFPRRFGYSSAGPWLCVDLADEKSVHQFAIWKSTGDVYRLEGNGAVEDDPFMMVGHVVPPHDNEESHAIDHPQGQAPGDPAREPGEPPGRV